MVADYVNRIKRTPDLEARVAFHRELPYQYQDIQDEAVAQPQLIQKLMDGCGIARLHPHQEKALRLIRQGHHLVVSTPTASGKTLIYNFPVIEEIVRNFRSTALYLFPLKALAQDQLKTFRNMAAHVPGQMPEAAVYDGDTSAWHRKRIRQKPPNVIMSNPEMAHLSFLAHHDKWAEFIAGLKYIVIDEVHVYRGVLGSHMAQLFKRLQRICRHYGSFPRYIFTSATIANPKQFVHQLSGLGVEALTEGNPHPGSRHLLLLEPWENAIRTGIYLLKTALEAGLRTIVYTQSRKMAELLSVWVENSAASFKDRISAYRAGFLPGERREIESRLARGDLLAVVSTSALELGIDIGDLDLCILFGYPGSIMATRQRGGRVGRNGQDSALILIAGEDALDRYFLHNPEIFLEMGPEPGIVNPYNSYVLSRHLVCAAAELPIRQDEPYLRPSKVQAVVEQLETEGKLLRSRSGEQLFAGRRRPHREVSLRGTGQRYAIMSGSAGDFLGEIDGFRVFKETHPGAIYLHRGRAYRVEGLDFQKHIVTAEPVRADYYTKVRGFKDTEILETLDRRDVCGIRFYRGTIRVTDQVTGYDKWRTYGRGHMGRTSLDLPPLIFETEALWFAIPTAVQHAAEQQRLHFMGGIHALEHAIIGIFPLLVLADRNDLGGISTPHHPQVGEAAIFIYDGIPGGAGLTLEGYRAAETMLEQTARMTQSCPCKNGCPSCVHSPKCGSGNRPIDKQAALWILKRLMEIPERTLDRQQGVRFKSRVKKPLRVQFQVPSRPRQDHQSENTGGAETDDFVVFDLETRRSAQEVGGWHKADRMGVSCAVVYDSRTDRYGVYFEEQIDQLLLHLQKQKLVVGFNVKRFDYRVLSGYKPADLDSIPTLDMLEIVHQRLGYRLSLDHLAKVTLGIGKSADGLQALKWWAEGKIDEIVEYCKSDVRITRDLYLFGKQNGYLLFNNKAGQTVRVPVEW